jgi:hypothetical protein
MSRNIGIVDQVIRSVLGLAFITYFLKDSFADGVSFAGFVGAYLLGTALFVYCPRYGALGLSTYGRLDRSV